MLNTLRQAIEAKRSVEFLYKGLRRVVSPHIVGYKGDRQYLFGYQTSGGSSSGLEDGDQNWRCFELIKITDLTLSDHLWSSDDSYDPETQWCITVRVLEVTD